MTYEETNRLLQVMRVAYPSLMVEPRNDALGHPGTVEVWYQFLKSYRAGDCTSAMDRFRERDSKRQFAPGLFEFEAEVKSIISERNDSLKRADAVKRVTHREGDNPETCERYHREVLEGGRPVVREFIRATKRWKHEYLENLRVQHRVRAEAEISRAGVRGLRFVRDDLQSAASAKDVGGLVDALKNKMSMPEPEAQDYSERYEWGSVWETMDAAAALPMQDDTPITPADFRKQREAL